MQVIKDHGYPIEKHFYTTEDDYINCVFRISGPRGTSAKFNTEQQKKGLSEKRPVIVYQHGLLDSCAGICMDELDSFAFFLADQGFDVWMANSRGNKFSKHHTYMDPEEDKDYWKFSFYEMGRYDQPALLEFILNKTGQEKLTYMGHS